MRSDTKTMIQLLQEHTALTDRQARRQGITNPRREYAIIKQCTSLNVSMHHQTEKKREYQLNED